MPSILFMNTELLSCPPTDNSASNCQHSSVNVKGSRHVSTALSCFLFYLSQNWYDGGGVSVNWSQGSNSTVLKKPRKLHFFKDTFAKLFSLLLLAQSHGNVFILTAVLMKGTALLLYKTQQIPHTKAFQKSFRWWWLSSDWGQPL